MNFLDALLQSDGPPRAGAGAGDDAEISPAAGESPDRKALQAALDRLGRSCARRIGFDIDGRQVRLQGHVRTYFQKQLAQHFIMQIDGVEQVVNQLSVE